MWGLTGPGAHLARAESQDLRGDRQSDSRGRSRRLSLRAEYRQAPRPPRSDALPPKPASEHKEGRWRVRGSPEAVSVLRVIENNVTRAP